MNEPRFTIGTKFVRRQTKRSDICTIVDILKTYNSKNELVDVRYVADCEFCGQTLTYNDVGDTTVAKGLIKE